MSTPPTVRLTFVEHGVEHEELRAGGQMEMGGDILRVVEVIGSGGKVQFHDHNLEQHRAVIAELEACNVLWTRRTMEAEAERRAQERPR